jgi:hypothetical protein
MFNQPQGRAFVDFLMAASLVLVFMISRFNKKTDQFQRAQNYGLNEKSIFA